MIRIPDNVESMYYEDAILAIMDMDYDQETAEFIWQEINRENNFQIKKES